MDNESNAKKSSRLSLDKTAAIILMLGIFLTPLIFWPAFGLSLEAVKKIFLAGTVVIALALWFIGRLKTKTLSIPRTYIWAAAGLFLLFAVISAAASGSAWSSFLGIGIESGTVFSLAIFFGLALLATEYFASKQKFLKFYVWLFGIFAVAFLFQATRYLFGNFLPWPVFDYGAANLIGKWNDFGILAGLVALSTTIMLELFPLKEAKSLKIFIWLSLVASVITLLFVNFYSLWVVLAIFFLLIYLLNLTVLARRSDGHKTYLRLSLALLVLSVLFVVFATPLSYDAKGQAQEGVISKQVRSWSEKLKISTLEVRPSWRGTLLVTGDTLKADPALGVGPNHFSQTWLLHKPAGVNDSQFWNLEPEFGVGFVPSFFATTGLLGGLSLLAVVLLLLVAGVRSLLNSKTETLDKTFLLLSFAGVAYGWTILVIYVPQTSVLAICFALTGLLLARLVDTGELKQAILPLATNAKTKFISALASIGVGVVLIILVAGWLTAGSAIAFVQRAGAVLQTGGGNLAKAETLVNKAVWLNPEDIYYRTAAQVNLSQLNALLAKKLPQDQTMTEYSKIFAVAKNNVDGAVLANSQNYQNFVARGSLYENIMTLGVKGAYDLAKKNYVDAAALNPFGPDMDLNLARLEIGNGSYPAAEKYLDSALKQKKDYLEAIFLQSQLYAERGYLDSAIKRLEYAVQLAPNDAGVLFQLGYLKYRNADYRGATAAMQTAVQLVPNYANALYFLGLSLDKLGQTDQALAAFQIIGQANPDNGEVTKIIANLKAGQPALQDTTVVPAKK